ncbi:MAG TPA: superoxide dismutase family protein, partial [Cytophagaceae bacterium]
MNLKATTLQLLTLTFALSLYSCTGMKGSIKKQAKALIASTKTDTEGSGIITFTQTSNNVEMELNLNFPSKAGQTVAVHIHEHGDCGNGGNDAHGHWNPTKANHGKWGAAAFHLGDIGN